MKAHTATALICSTLAALLASTPAVASDKPAKSKSGQPELSAEQLANAERVLTGKMDCEFNQSVDIAPAAKKGYFTVGFKGKSYTLAPEATTTGAVRLEDKKAGIVWLQIANKSMLMNSKIGQRLVDNCVHPSQKS